MTKTMYLSLIITSVIAVVLMTVLLWSNASPAIGSVEVSNEYQATTTGQTADLSITASKLITNATRQRGALGSVVITGANTGFVWIYDATTTNATLRAPSAGTSTILIASFPPSTAVGTYTFDAEYTNGLLVEISGIAPTTTVSFR